MLWVSGASPKESAITHTAPQQSLTYVWPCQIWNTSAAIPQLDLVLGPQLLNRFVVSGTRNVELIMSEEHYVVTVNNNEEKKTKQHQLPAVWRWPSFFQTVSHCTHLKQSKTFLNFWRGPISKFGADAEQTLADTAGDGRLSLFSHLQKCSFLLWIYYFMHRNSLENKSFSPSTTLFASSSLSFYHMVTWWWHHFPPHHTWIHQSLGHVIACGPTKLHRWLVCDCSVFFFVICLALL